MKKYLLYLLLTLNPEKSSRSSKNRNYYENIVWKLVIDKNDEYIVYLKQVFDGYQIVTYNLKTEEKKLLMETKVDNKYLGFIIGPNNELVMGIDNIINFFDLGSHKLIKSIHLNEEKTITGKPIATLRWPFLPTGT